MERYVCIHGHFYQPPRENPWLEAIQLQDSAYPYHDWNERIAAECYAPNAASRILDGEGRIVKIINNYARISFDVGPTLLSWLEYTTPEIYQAILAADRESQKIFSGHGSALAQAYNHMILPLVQLVMIAYPILGRYGRSLRHDLRHRFRRLVKRVRMLIPFANKLAKLGLEVLLRFKVGDAQAFALEDAAPLFHLIHP